MTTIRQEVSQRKPGRVTTISRATNINDIYRAFRTQPLTIEELDAFYCDTDKARGDLSPRNEMAMILSRDRDLNHHILFVGYKGCGKSTELNHLQKDIQNDYLVLNYSVMTELDPAHLNYIELFILTMQKLFDAAVNNKLEISERFIKRIMDWLATKEIAEIKDKYIGVEAKVGSDTSIGIPYLQKFFLKFKLSAKSSGSLKETLKRNIEPKLSELIEHCNDLIREVVLDLDRINKKALLIIFEDLDKIPLNRGQELFFNYTTQLTALQTNVIYTFPISLYNNIRFNTIRTYFTSFCELPMIKVLNRDGSENREGMDTLKKLVNARMDSDQLFQSSEILKQMILDSGGCIRDLFLMIGEAADFAIRADHGRITETDRHKAWLRRKREYANSIADNDMGEVKVPVDAYYEVLVKLASSKSKIIDNTTPLMHLRDNLCVLGYNGEGWCDVHPIVKQILLERKKWDGTQSGI